MPLPHVAVSLLAGRGREGASQTTQHLGEMLQDGLCMVVDAVGASCRAFLEDFL